MNIHQIKVLSIFLCVGLFVSCSNKKLTRPMEQYKSILDKQEISKIRVPVSFSKNKIEEIINKVLPDPLYNDDDSSGDNMKVRATKHDSIKVSIDGKKINYIIPLDIWVEKGLGITDVEAEGKISLEMETIFDIAKDWSMESNTELKNFEWIEKPVLKLGFMDFPVEKIASGIIGNAKEKITAAIDQEISKSTALRDQITKGWEKIKSPILVSEKEQVWLLLSPKTIGLSSPESVNDSLKSNIYVECKPVISVGEKMLLDSVYPLPEMSWVEDGDNQFHLNLLTEISYTEAEKLAKQYAVGKTFEEGKRKITIDDIKLFGQNEKLIVDALVSGSYNGHIYMTGKPVFNETKNLIEIEDLDYELKTKNFLVSSFGWIVKKGLRKTMQEKMKFPLEDNLDKVKVTIQEQLNERELANGIRAKGVLDDFKVTKTMMTPNSIAASVSLKGRLNIILDELNL